MLAGKLKACKAREKGDCPTAPAAGYDTPMRRPSKIELEFVMLMACMVIPLGYWAVRTLLALIGG